LGPSSGVGQATSNAWQTFGDGEIARLVYLLVFPGTQVEVCRDEVLDWID